MVVGYDMNFRFPLSDDVKLEVIEVKMGQTYQVESVPIGQTGVSQTDLVECEKTGQSQTNPLSDDVKLEVKSFQMGQTDQNQTNQMGCKTDLKFKYC